ncbi:MAG: hypothetical protein WCV63_05255 [Negativicutes bacterium]
MNNPKSKIGLFTLIAMPLAIVVMLIVLLVKRGMFAIIVRQVKNLRNKKS